MEERSFWEIDSIDRDLLEAVVRRNGRLPDNFVDSSEGNFMHPDPSDPEVQRLVEQLDEKLVELTAGGEESPSRGVAV